LAVEMASKLTYIKHNLILEYPNLFMAPRKRKIDQTSDEIIEDSEFVIEDC
jgi:hypothetical protein